MGREVPFGPHVRCDICGKPGAYHFMGDCLCSVCYAKLSDDAQLGYPFTPTNPFGRMTNQSDFDDGCRLFTDKLSTACRWKHSFFGAAYSTRLRQAIACARSACDDMEKVLEADDEVSRRAVAKIMGSDHD